MKRTGTDKRSPAPPEIHIGLQHISYVQIADSLNSLVAYHNLACRFQQSMIDCPEYFGLCLLSGLIGLINPSNLYLRRVLRLIPSSAQALFTQYTPAGLQVGGNSLMSYCLLEARREISAARPPFPWRSSPTQEYGSTYTSS